MRATTDILIIGAGPSGLDLAGYGSSGDPGIHWYFEHVQSKLGV
jgi:ribulose 1,5-bisphosphate synthetase/thiazole synthase